jgi:hypothetical protein
VTRYRISLEQQQYAPSTINLRLAAVRRLAYEASDCGLLSPDLAAGIRRVKGARRLGVRIGNWLTAEEGKRLIGAFGTLTLKEQRNRAMRYFEFVFAREDFRETKPNPEPYLLALERLQMKADKCVAVEDSERGLAAARAAGLCCLMIPNDMTRVCNFRGATAILPRAAAVLDALADL